MNPIGLFEHFLTAGHGDCLTGLVILFADIENRSCDIDSAAASSEGNLALVKFKDIGGRFCAGDLSCPEILNEKPFFGICPEGTFKEVSGADCVDLDIIRGKLHCEALGKTDAAEFASGIGKVLVASGKTGFRVDLDYIEQL